MTDEERVRADAERLRKRADELDALAAEQGTMVKGSAGQMIVNPAIREARASRVEANRLIDRLRPRTGGLSKRERDQLAGARRGRWPRAQLGPNPAPPRPQPSPLEREYNDLVDVVATRIDDMELWKIVYDRYEVRGDAPRVISRETCDALRALITSAGYGHIVPEGPSGTL